MKLEAKDLRIGNYVRLPKCKVGDELEAPISSVGIKIQEEESCYEPIELTEGWLLKFGFLSNPYKDRYELGLFFVHCDKTTGALRLWCEINDRIVDLKTVHHLQNLYFSIYEKELTIDA